MTHDNRPSLADHTTRVMGCLSLAALGLVASLLVLHWAAATLDHQYWTDAWRIEREREASLYGSRPDQHGASVEPNQSEVPKARTAEEKANELLFNLRNPGLEERFKDVRVRPYLRDAEGKLQYSTGALEWWHRNLQYGDAGSRLALVALAVVAAMFLLGPGLLLVWLTKRWTPRSPTQYACRLSMWGAALVGGPTGRPWHASPTAS
jgi:hypothetical protein